MTRETAIHMQDTRRSRTRWQTRVAAAVLTAGLLMGATPALADDYERERAGHPLRIVAYVLHPVGVVVDFLFLRPAHWLGHYEPFATIFGHEDY